MGRQMEISAGARRTEKGQRRQKVRPLARAVDKELSGKKVVP